MQSWRSPVRENDRSADGRTKPIIIVADDDRDTRELYRACFDMSGYQTAEAANGEQALLMVKRLRPDVLLTDLVLPGIDGMTLTRLLKQDPFTAAVRVVLITGYASDNLEQRAAAAGIDRALLKPCLPKTMLREVGRVLQRPRPAAGGQPGSAPVA
jgi:CheY-like chemotaxis protein